MTTDRRRARGMFVPLQANYFMDPAIVAVGNQGELAYLRSLAVAKLADRDGVLSVHQLRPVRARIRSWDDVVDALLEHKLWVPASTGSDYRIRSWSQHNETKVEREAVNAQEAARKRTFRRRPEPPTVIDVSGRTPRVESREEKREKSTERTPSGSVRSVLPPVAGRGAEGAPPPAIVAEVRSQLQQAAAQRRAKLNTPRTSGNGRAEHVNFAATLAKLTEAAERLNPSDSEGNG